MLVLSRKKGQTIVCTLPGGDQITFTILDDRYRGRYGIEAPPTVRILRGELEPHGVEDSPARQHVRRP